MKRIFPALLICFGLLAACRQEKENLKELVAAIDVDLTSGALKSADENIRTAASLASSRSEWLTVLKRAYLLGSASGTYETLYAASRTAISRISGAEEIAALCVFAALRTGKIEMAYRYAREYLTNERWRALANEAVLRKRALDKGVPAITSEENPLLGAVFSEDPIQLAAAAHLFGDIRFSLAAALKFALRGEMTTAAHTIEPHLAEYPEAALLLLYDVGRLEDARRTFEWVKRLELDLLRCDIYLKLHQYHQALELYRTLISHSPGLSWIPYANTAIMLARQGQQEDAMEVLAAGNGIFQNVRQLLLAKIAVFSESKPAADLEYLMSRYVEQYGYDPDIALLSAAINPTHANRVRLENSLWHVFLVEPEDSRTARYLAASLIASNDHRGLSRLVGVWEEANGETAWSLFLTGYRALMDHATEAAVEAFKKSYELSQQWETAYNVGVLAGRRGDYAAALEYVRMAESRLVRNDPEAVEAKALLRAALARILYQRGDFGIAAKEAMYALDLDPGSNEAAILVELLKKEID